jgi:hypothetical protein
MNHLQNYFDARETVGAAAKDFVDAIRGVEIIKGREAMEASTFTLGYLESFMVGQIAKLPAKYRKEIVAELQRVTLAKLNDTKELA